MAFILKVLLLKFYVRMKLLPDVDTALISRGQPTRGRPRPCALGGRLIAAWNVARSDGRPTDRDSIGLS